MRTLEDRVAALERRVAQLTPQVEDDLGDILRCFPGGIQALADASGYHRESVYQFANASRTKGFPIRRAMRIARAFGDHRALGRKVTVVRLRASWDKQHQKNEGR